MSARAGSREEAVIGLLAPRWPGPEDIVAHLYDALGEAMPPRVRKRRKSLADLTSSHRGEDLDAICAELGDCAEQSLGFGGREMVASMMPAIAWRAQTLGASTPMTGIRRERAEALVREGWAPMLRKALEKTRCHFAPAEDSLEDLARSPLRAWLTCMSKRCGLDEEQLVQLVFEQDGKDDPVTRVRRWERSGRIGQVSTRHVRSQIRTGCREGWFPSFAGPDADAFADQAALLFAIARGLSHLPQEWRQALSGEVPLADIDIDATGQPLADQARRWQLLHQGAKLEALDGLVGAIRCAMMQGRERVPRLRGAIRKAIDDLPPPGRRDFQPFLKWIDAEIAARRGEAKAAGLFLDAMRGLWMRGGPVQQDLLRDALLHAVHSGADLRDQRRLWALAQNLGVEPQNQTLDASYKRLAVAATQRYGPIRDRSRGDHRRRVDAGPMPVFDRAEVKRIMETGVAAPNDLRVLGEAKGHRYSPLMLAASMGSPAHIHRLLDAGGDPGRVAPHSNVTALANALIRRKNAELFGREGREEACEALHLFLAALKPIDRSVDPDAWNVPSGDEQIRPLWHALTLFDPTVVEALLDKGVPLRSRGGDRREECVPNQSPIFSLLQARAGRERPTSNPEVIAMMTSSEAPPKLFEARLGAGSVQSTAEVRSRIPDQAESPEGRAILDPLARLWWRPMSEAEREGFGRILALLLSRGADPNQRSLTMAGEQKPPLHFAAEMGWTDVMQTLLDHGADPQQKVVKSDGTMGNAAWIYASTFGGEAAVNILRGATG